MSRGIGQGPASRTALVGVLAAGGLAVLWLACLVPSGYTGVTAAAGLFPVAAVLVAGRTAGYLCWAAIALLGLFLLPNKAVALLFTVFLGLYPVVKSRIEQFRDQLPQWGLKLLYFNAAFALVWLGLRSLLGLSLPEWLSGRAWLLLPAANVVFVIYDVGLSKLIALLACLVLALPAFAAPQKADAISGISSEKVLDIVKANKGKLVFINFFATWCPPCREEIPELISIRKAYPADKVVIVGISLDSDRGKLESFAEAMNFNYPVYLAEPDVPALFGISSIPFNLLYDKTGKLVAGGPGMVGKEDLEEAFSGLLN